MTPLSEVGYHCNEKENEMSNKTSTRLHHIARKMKWVIAQLDTSNDKAQVSSEAR